LKLNNIYPNDWVNKLNIWQQMLLKWRFAWKNFILLIKNLNNWLYESEQLWLFDEILIPFLLLKRLRNKRMKEDFMRLNLYCKMQSKSLNVVNKKLYW
jgi:hypothetical protein